MKPNLAKKPSNKGVKFQSVIQDLYKNLQHVDEKSLHRALTEAMETANKLGEITYEEGQDIVKSLKQDIYHLSSFMQHAGALLVDWLRLDAKYFEKPTLDLLYRIADQTTLEQAQLEREKVFNTEYHTGDLVLIGKFTCSKCEKSIEMYHIDELPKCSACSNITFTRST